jgi:molybdopterin-guanine dinucleotide biosynthesis protein A
MRAKVPVPMIDRIAGVILAGGLARRMGGGDKGELKLGGKSILAHVVERLGPQVEALAINANGDPKRFSAYGLPVIADSIEGSPGPLAGVLAGLDWAGRSGFSHIVTAATDTPFLPRNLVARLEAAAQTAQVELAAAASGGRAHPVIGLWPCRLADDLRLALAQGMRKVDEWTVRHGVAEAWFESGPNDPFFNVNRPQDLEEAEALLESSLP